MRLRSASLLGLQYLMLDEPLGRMPRRFPRPSATQVYASPKRYIYRLGRTAPRAYIAHAIFPTDADSVMKAKALPDFDSAHEALIDPASIGQISTAVGRIDRRSSSELVAGYNGGSQTDASPEKVSILAYHDNEVTLDVDAQQAGVVVLHDLYFPGWEVKVDGVRTPLLRANILFRGVEVTAGRHIVEFEYRPFSIENLLAALKSVLHKSET
jgi:hypothetical protein